MATVSMLFGSSRPNIDVPKLEDSHAVGIEIELEHVQRALRFKYPWHVEIDGSLKVAGKEFTLPIWHNYALEALTDLFNSVKARSTARCGTHVHVDVTDYTGDEVKIAVLVYMIFENYYILIQGRDGIVITVYHYKHIIF